jgi:hypothetical protein
VQRFPNSPNVTSALSAKGELSPRQQFIQALRDMADLFEQNEEVPLPKWKQDISLFSTNDDSAKAELSAFARAIGKVAKVYGDELVTLSKDFGSLLQLRMHANREAVCERVVVGTKVIPARSERILPAEPEREEEIVEWHCTPVLEAANV